MFLICPLAPPAHSSKTPSSPDLAAKTVSPPISSLPGLWRNLFKARSCLQLLFSSLEEALYCCSGTLKKGPASSPLPLFLALGSNQPSLILSPQGLDPAGGLLSLPVLINFNTLRGHVFRNTLLQPQTTSEPHYLLS